MALSKKNDAVAAYTRASDQWAYYQAKGIKATILESQKSLLISLGKPASVSISQEIKRYQQEQQSISQKARSEEELSQQDSQAAEQLIEQHHGYSYSVAILQIAVALSAIAESAKNRSLWIMSIMVALLGTYFLGNSFFLKESSPNHHVARLAFSRSE